MLVVIPKNRGLSERAKRVAEDEAIASSRICMVRGEDIPAFVSMLATSGKHVTAYTGDDLLQDYLDRGGSLPPSLRYRRVDWDDTDAIFGKPSLCLIAPQGRELDARRRRVGICARYAQLAERGLTRLERELGMTFERSYHHGALETLLEHDVVDAIVDIVVTGSTIRSFDFRIIDVFFRSDLAVLETA